MDLTTAADAADALLAVEEPGTVVVRDPAAIFVNDEVISFNCDPESIDDRALVVYRETGEAALVTAPPYLADPFPGLVPADELDDDELKSL